MCKQKNDNKRNTQSLRFSEWGRVRNERTPIEENANSPLKGKRNLSK